MTIEYHQQFGFETDFKYYHLSKPKVIQVEGDEDRIGQLFSSNKSSDLPLPYFT